MKHKLKHLSRFCCKPANELEFEAVKMAAEIGGVDFDLYYDKENYLFYSLEFQTMDASYSSHIEHNFDEDNVIDVLDFCNKLRMSEEEARELEDDRVVFSEEKNRCKWSDYGKTLMAINGHYFKLSEDKTEVTLHKRESC